MPLAERLTHIIVDNTRPVIAPEFHWTAPAHVAPHMATALNPTWLRLSQFLGVVRPRRYAAIGCLVGTMEAYALQRCNWAPDRIVFEDLDIPAYNPLRDTGSHAYRNICSPMTSDFQGEFVYARADSQKSAILSALGPYDLILVDGCHSPEALKHDLEVAYNALDNESAMLVHDLELPNTGLGPAYQEWCRMKGVEHAELDKSIVVHGLGIVYKP